MVAKACLKLHCRPKELGGLAERFGSHRRAPPAGLLWLLNGDQLVELHRNRAIIETTTATRQTFRRRPVAVGELVLVWELVQGLAE